MCSALFQDPLSCKHVLSPGTNSSVLFSPGTNSPTVCVHPPCCAPTPQNPNLDTPFPPPHTHRAAAECPAFSLSVYTSPHTPAQVIRHDGARHTLTDPDAQPRAPEHQLASAVILTAQLQQQQQAARSMAHGTQHGTAQHGRAAGHRGTA